MQVELIVNQHRPKAHSDPIAKAQRARCAAIQQPCAALDRDRAINRRIDLAEGHEHAVANKADEATSTSPSRWLDDLTPEVAQADHRVHVVALDQPTVASEVANQNGECLPAQAMQFEIRRLGPIIPRRLDGAELNAAQQRIPSNLHDTRGQGHGNLSRRRGEPVDQARTNAPLMIGPGYA